MKYLPLTALSALGILLVSCEHQQQTETSRFGYQGTQTAQQPTPGPGPTVDLSQSQHGQHTSPPASTHQQITGPVVTDPPPAGGTTPPPPTPTTDPTTPPSSQPSGALAGGPDPTQPPAQDPTPSVTPEPEPEPETTPVTVREGDDFPYGIKVPGRDGYVYSPYDRDAGWVDVRQIPPGRLVECPYTNQAFRVP